MLGIIVESLVAGLLAVTIGYCVVVNRKLESLRADKSDLRAIIRDLYAATGHAETAIGTLRVNANTLEATLGEQIGRAQKASKRISEELDRGDALLSKLAVIAKNHSAREEAVREAQRAAAISQSAKRPRSRVGLGLLNEKTQQSAADDGDSAHAMRRDAA